MKKKLLEITKLRILKATHNSEITRAFFFELLEITKLRILKATHNSSRHTKFGELVVRNHKVTNFESNSQQ